MRMGLELDATKMPDEIGDPRQKLFWVVSLTFLFLIVPLLFICFAFWFGWWRLTSN